MVEIPSIPSERDLTRRHALLWTVVIVGTAFDVLTTLTGLAMGLREGNPLLRSLLASYGLAGVWLVKFAALLVLVVGWATLPDREAAIFLVLFALVTLAVVLSNALTLLGV